MNQIAIFKTTDQEYPLSIHDVKGQRWVPAAQVGEALGCAGIRSLISDLEAAGEIAEGKHIRRVSLQMPGDTQPRRHTVLSLRGIIRVSMRSQAERAIAFRDWAEDVLADVMETGSYTTAPKQLTEAQKMREANALTKAYIEAAKIFGHTEQMGRMLGAKRAQEVTGVDYSPFLLGFNDVPERPVTPTNLGKLLNPVVSARADRPMPVKIITG